MPPENDNCHNVQHACFERFTNIESDTGKIPDMHNDVKEILREQKRINGTIIKHNLLLMGENNVPGLVENLNTLATTVSKNNAAVWKTFDKMRPKIISLWVLFGIILASGGYFAQQFIEHLSSGG